MTNRRRPNRLEMGGKPAARVLRTSRTHVPATLTGDEEPPTKPPPPVALDAVVERRSKKKKKSKLATNRSKTMAKEATQHGFPSFSAPLGTLARHNDDNNPRASEQTDRTPLEGANTLNPLTPSPTQNNNPTVISKLMQDSSKEADQMLRGMSSAEIRESLQEIKTSMDPKTLKFLMNRKKKQNAKASITPPKHQDSSNPLPSNPDTVASKEEFASTLASINTYEDLDAAYHSYQQQQKGTDVSSPLESTVQGSSEFEVACQLLRSSSPRQTLWAARTVAKQLSEATTRPAECHIRPQEQPPSVPFPILLPVSLRCLLDGRLSSNSGPGILQITYVLQSLETLVRLRVCTDHAVDLTSVNDERSVFQNFFLCDAVPGPSMATCYQSAPADDTPQEETSPVYYTGASTAQADAQAFWNDPLWTLLSKMRILPCCAQLLQQQLPDEALQSIAGILAMVAQRSAGAATAIVQHTSLLKDLWGQHRRSSWFVCCILLRQSRYTAEHMAEALLPQILQELSHEDTVSEDTFPQQALVAWRILSRYGVLQDATTNNRTLLTLAAPHLGVKGKELAPDFYAAMAAASRNNDDDGDDWLHSAAQQRQAIQHLKDAMDSNRKDETGNWRLVASILQFFQSYFRSMETSVHNEAFTQILEDMANSQLIQEAYRITLPLMSQLDVVKMHAVSPELLRKEASACAVVSAFVDVVWTRGTKVAKQNVLNSILQAPKTMASSGQGDVVVETTASRRNWVNRMSSSVVLFLLDTKDHHPEGLTEQFCRELSFTLIGRLEVGDEASLHCLLKFKHIFGGSLEIGGVLARQLLGSTSREHMQLVHSLKLYEVETEKNLDLPEADSSNGSLRSLLSETEGQGSIRASGDNLLPVGQYWLWQFLAGEVGNSDADNVLNKESSAVILSTLSLVDALEDKSEFYAKTLDTGPKLYFLANICLLGSALFSSTPLIRLVDKLLDRYVPRFSRDSQELFAQACRKHFTSKKSAANGTKEDSDRQAKALLQSMLPSETQRSLETFVNDLMDVHNDGGVDSEICTKVLRLFLCDKIPTQCRCKILEHFNGALHLLSLPNERAPQMSAWLGFAVGGGLPAVDGSLKDPPKLLDCIADKYIQKLPVRDDDAFVSTWACVLFVRSLAISMKTQSGIDVAITRAARLNAKLLFRVVSSLPVFLASDGNARSLIQSVTAMSSIEGETVPPDSFALVASLREFVSGSQVPGGSEAR